MHLLDGGFIDAISRINQLFFLCTRRVWLVHAILKAALFLLHALLVEYIPLTWLLKWILLVIQVEVIFVGAISTCFGGSQIFRMIILPINYLFALLKLIIFNTSHTAELI